MRIKMTYRLVFSTNKQKKKIKHFKAKKKKKICENTKV